MTRKRLFLNISVPLACLGLILIFFLYAPSLFNKITYDVFPIQNWRSSPSQDAELFELPHTLKWDDNGVCNIYTTLPDNAAKKNSNYLCFWTYLSSVEVYVEDTIVYYYNNADTESFTAASSSQYNFVEIPEGSGGKQLTISLKSPYRDFEPLLVSVMCGDIHQLHHWLNQKYYTFRFGETFMIWCGILLLLIGLFLGFKNKRFYAQIWGGLLLILFGCYTSTATQSLPLENITVYTKDFVCYFSLFTLSIPLTLYSRCKVGSSRKKSLVCEILVCIEILTFIISFLLHNFDLLDIHYSLPYSMALLLISLICSIAFSIDHYVRKHAKSALPAILYSVFVLTILLTEYTHFYFVNFLPFRTGLISRIGGIFVSIVEVYLLFVNITNEIKEKSRIENDHRNLQLQMLTDNIRPHFILNTIGAIRTLIPKEPEHASELLLDFSKYIRENLEQKDYYSPIPFLEELDHIRTYISLEKARFGDTIEVYYNCQDTQFRVLPLTIQPFVENSIKHGLFASNGILWISTYATPEGHLIEVIDNGSGFDTAHLEEVMLVCAVRLRGWKR